MPNLGIKDAFAKALEEIKAEPGLAVEVATIAGVSPATVYRAIDGADSSISVADSIVKALAKIRAERAASAGSAA